MPRRKAETGRRKPGGTGHRNGGRRYSIEEQAHWIVALQLNGKGADARNDYYAVGHVHSIPGAPAVNSLHRWWRKYQESLSMEIKTEVGKKLEHAVASERLTIKQRLQVLLLAQLDRALQLTDDTTDLRTLMVGIGIIIDKINLLSGMPTEIRATTDLEKVRDLLSEGKLTEAVVRERWPTIADELFGSVEK